jgi:hypothetical protein
MSQIQYQFPRSELSVYFHPMIYALNCEDYSTSNTLRSFQPLYTRTHDFRPPLIMNLPPICADLSLTFFRAQDIGDALDFI